MEEKVSSPLLSVDFGPHVKTDENISKIMWTVSLTLLPAGIWGIYVFGIRALFQFIVATLSAMIFEAIILKVRKLPLKDTLDGSAFLSGLLLAYCLPVTLPYWMTALGSVFTIGIAKHCFGGLGFNIFNPAHAGRAFLMASFPVEMTSHLAVYGMTSATPLGILKEHGVDKLVDAFGGQLPLYKALFLGTRGGCIGEVSTILLILGGAFLIYKRYIFWQTPFFYIFTVGVLSWILGGDPLFHMMSGGVIIGAFFMLTDMVTSPITVKGQIIFATGAGIIVVLIRKFGSYPEGVCYSILLMNALTPLIDRFTLPNYSKEERA